MNGHSTWAKRGEASGEELRPYRHLAIRVLALALLDVANPNGSVADRESARQFLNGSGMLQHWCRVAALEPSCIAKLADRAATGRVTEQNSSAGSSRPGWFT